jgi:hypothetical protein
LKWQKLYFIGREKVTDANMTAPLPKPLLPGYFYCRKELSSPPLRPGRKA